MKTFVYKGLDRSGLPAKGFVEAENPKQARARLAHDGILADWIAACGSQGTRLALPMRTALYRELAALIEAGLPLVVAFDTLIAAPDMRTAAGTLSRIRDAVRDGARLADALESSGCQAGGFEVALIRVAETTGEMGPVLDRLAGYMESRRNLTDSIRSALIYPFFVLGVGLLAAVTMLGVLLPRAQEAAAASAMRLPLLTRLMLMAGRAGMQWGWLVIVCGIAIGLVGVAQWRRSDHARLRAERLWVRLPVIGKGIRILVNMRFTQALHLLLQGGVPLVDAFRMAGQATGNAWCMAEVEREAERLRHGDNLAACAGRIELLGADTAGLLHTGQAGGSLPRLLAGGAARFERHWERYIKRTLAVIEPVLLLMLGGFVLMVTLSVMLPFLAITRMLP